MTARKSVIGLVNISADDGELMRSLAGQDVRMVDVAASHDRGTYSFVLMPESEGEIAIKRFIAAGHRVVVLLPRPDLDAEVQMLALGASGCIATDTPTTGLRRSIAAALAGEFVFSRRALGRAILKRSTPDDRVPSELTQRQREILSLIAEGATSKEIAWKLGIQATTVEKHTMILLRRLGASNRAAATAALHRARRPGVFEDTQRKVG